MEEFDKEPQPEAEAVTQVRNQLRLQDLATVDAESFSTVGGRLFPDSAAVPDLRDLVSIVDSWRASHAVAYGGCISGTDSVTNHQVQDGATDETVLAPTGSQLHQIQAVSIVNSGPQPMTAHLLVSGVIVGDILTINPTEKAGFTISNSLTVGASTPLQINLVSGTAADALVKIASILVGV